MTNLELFCKIYTESQKNQSAAIQLADRLAEIWDELPLVDKKIAKQMLDLPEPEDTPHD